MSDGPTRPGLRRRPRARWRALLGLWRAELRAHRGRTLATGVTIALGAALLTAALVLGDSARTSIEDGAGVEYAGPAGSSPGRRGADVVVRTSAVSDSAGGATSSGGATGAAGTGIAPEQLARLRGLPGVERAAAFVQAEAAVQVGDRVRGITVESLADDPSFVWQQLEAGRSPVSGSEIAVTRDTLDELRIRLGDRLALGRPGVGRALFTVVGVLDVRGSLQVGRSPYGVVTPAVAQSLAGTVGPTAVLLRATPGTSPDRLVDVVNARAPVGWPETASSLRSASLGVNADRAVALSSVAASFAAVGLLIAGLVLGTTSTVALGSRRRTLALLRALGAPRAVAVALIVAEVLALAAVAAIVGAAAGVLLARLGLPATASIPGLPRIDGAAFTVHPGALAAAVGAALLLAAIAATVPALWVARIRPADALREAPGRRPTPVGSLVGPSLLAAGIVAALALDGWPGMIVATVLLTAGALGSIAPAMRAVAAVGTRRATGRRVLRRLNARTIAHQPSRAAAEALAVVVAVALVSATWLGSASIAETASARLARTAQPDLTLGAPSGQEVVAPELRRSLRQVDGVQATVGVRSSPEAIVVGTGARRRVRVAGGVAGVSRRALDAVFPADAAVHRLRDDVVLLPRTGYPPYPPGARVSLRGPHGRVDGLRVEYVRDLPATSLVTPALLRQVARRTEVHVAWIRLGTGPQRTAALAEVAGLAVLGGPLPIDGPALTDARITHAIETARTAATALLALAILVAIIGAATTFALSVAEQRREHVTLRAIGLDRRRLRSLLLRRVVAVTVVGTAIGVLLGTALAVLLVDRVAAALDVPAVHAWPVPPIVVLVVAVLLVVRAATLLPLDRAARVSPARALAEG
ncbi:ABC transporter integral membrane protein [Patulibacter medicamentivorans]|uniref:ABC transporter integral membrane protein n=1 Tax=Patulibacter medicamentivorans TaxID=1097667 RepID=H0E007_9ACTN|nr:FtsX-like permease family protein [Patulibacter medicamentivorans]EHN12966.1 ABC transporter integral membrane protein [Patulibacter medicamentivorans]